jgi:hypothetical protein
MDELRQWNSVDAGHGIRTRQILACTAAPFPALPVKSK